MIFDLVLLSRLWVWSSREPGPEMSPGTWVYGGGQASPCTTNVVAKTKTLSLEAKITVVKIDVAFHECMCLNIDAHKDTIWWWQLAADSLWYRPLRYLRKYQLVQIDVGSLLLRCCFLYCDMIHGEDHGWKMRAVRNTSVCYLDCGVAVRVQNLWLQTHQDDQITKLPRCVAQRKLNGPALGSNEALRGDKALQLGKAVRLSWRHDSASRTCRSSK